MSGCNGWLFESEMLRQRIDSVLWLLPDSADPGVRTAEELVARLENTPLAGGAVRMQCSDRKLADTVGPVLHNSGVALDPINYDWLLYVVRVMDDAPAWEGNRPKRKGGGEPYRKTKAEGKGKGKGRAPQAPRERFRYGLFPAAARWQFDSQRNTAASITEGMVAKACLKLSEGMLLAGVPPNPDMVVVDLGAAPGSWTQWLAPQVLP